MDAATKLGQLQGDDRPAGVAQVAGRGRIGIGIQWPCRRLEVACDGRLVRERCRRLRSAGA